MRLLATIFTLSAFSPIFAQDGSNIKYIKSENLDNTHIGKICHVDFESRSFGGRNIDTLQIDVKGKLIRFVEHRVDNGFNNWFREQYLETVPSGSNIKMRLQNSKIDSLTSNKIYVTSVLEYGDYDAPIDTITVFSHWYFINNVSEVLIKD